jgi:hypothetical protein
MWFEITTPDDRIIRHEHPSLEAAKAALVDGYAVSGEVIGCDASGKGGLVNPLGPGSKSLMKTLLEAHGDELLSWLARNKIEPRK